MDDNNQPRPNEDWITFFRRQDEEAYERMTPFERYLFDNGLFDDVVRPPIFESDTVLEPADLCSNFDCDHCIGYQKYEDQVTHCTCECHKKPAGWEVPFNHCSYLGCEDCTGLMVDGVVTSHCTCEHHKAKTE